MLLLPVLLLPVRLPPLLCLAGSSKETMMLEDISRMRLECYEIIGTTEVFANLWMFIIWLHFSRSVCLRQWTTLPFNSVVSRHSVTSSRHSVTSSSCRCRHQLSRDGQPP